MTRILVIDNYDSFVFNLVHYLAQLGASVDVRRNDAISIRELATGGYDGVLMSPGPGHPDDAGICIATVRELEQDVPLFGVCLGHQAIGAAYGGSVGRAEELLHGKTSWIEHSGTGVFAGLPLPFTATRYHSLAIDADTMPSELEVTASTATGIVMGVRHRELPVEGVQFHPESVLTVGGHRLLANWLAGCGMRLDLDRVAVLAEKLDAQRRNSAVVTAA